MANLFFPQLSSRAMTQFPFRKHRSVRTIQNVMADGSIISNPDPTSARVVWNLNFNELSAADILPLEQFYTQCSGPFCAFTFIDPADNMLAYSSDMSDSAWLLSPGLRITGGTADPLGGASAFTLSNAGQTAATISQLMPVPANYQYCFSIYAQSPVDAATIGLIRSGPAATESAASHCGTAWTRVVTSGRLNDAGIGFTAAIQVQPGQTISLFGPQVEPQIEPSTYRATSMYCGIYPKAHWSSNQLWFSADGPGATATSFSIESVV